jgi:SpoVK/Ycf46/Vps4 family AAA+-type ATPase
MNDKHDLASTLSGHFPLVTIQSHEETRALALLLEIAREQGRPLLTWSVTDGLRRDRHADGGGIDWKSVTFHGQRDTPVRESADSPERMLRDLQRAGDRPIVALLDFHPYLNEPRIVRRLKELAIGHPQNGISVVLISHQLDLPAELGRLSAAFELSLPDTAQIKRLIQDEAQIWSIRNSNQNLKGDKEAYRQLARALTGLTVTDVKRLVRNAIYDDGAITHSDVPEVMEAKYRLIGQDGLLSFEYDTARFTEVGGLARLKGWLNLRKSAFLDGAAGPLEPPKGILLLGVQGSGKSLAAKAVAGTWGVPLLRLDVGTLYNKYIGETERNIRQSLAAAEVMAPCVLWVDEIEKGFATSDNDDGTSLRVLGTLLTWMAEHPKSVFIVATANDVQSLPPELIRKGRLDEVFFVDLPGVDARRSIFDIHLAKRDTGRDEIDTRQLALASDGFSGAEIEQAVISALYAAHGMRQPISTEIILSEVQRTRPLAIVMAEQIAVLRGWAAGRTVPAD